MGVPWAQLTKTAALGIDNLIANKGAQNARDLQIDAGNRNIATNQDWMKQLQGMYSPYQQTGGNAMQSLVSMASDPRTFQGYGNFRGGATTNANLGVTGNGSRAMFPGGTDGGTARTSPGGIGTSGPVAPGPKQQYEVPIENPIGPIGPTGQGSPQSNPFDAANFFLNQQQQQATGPNASVKFDPFVPQGIGGGTGGRAQIDQRGLDFATQRSTDAAMQRLKALGLGDSGASVNAVAELGANLGNQFYNEAWQRGNTEGQQARQNNIALQQLGLQGRGQDMSFAGQQDNQRLNLMKMGLDAQGQGFGQDLANRNYGLNANQQGFNQGMANRQFDFSNRQFDWNQLQGNRDYDSLLRNQQIALQQYLAGMGMQGTNTLAQLGTGINTNIGNTQLDMGNAQAAAESAKWNNARNAHNGAFNTWMPSMASDFQNPGGGNSGGGGGGGGMMGGLGSMFGSMGSMFGGGGSSGGGEMFGGSGSIGSMFGSSGQMFSTA